MSLDFNAGANSAPETISAARSKTAFWKWYESTRVVWYFCVCFALNWFNVFSLASQKIAIAEKSLRFQIAKYQIEGFVAEIAEKSPENRRRNRRKIAEKSLAIFRAAE